MKKRDDAEIKRLYVFPQTRGKRIGRTLLTSLEKRACALGMSVVCLETGVKQLEAISLYKGCSYTEIETFGDYRHDPNSIFMHKNLVCIPVKNEWKKPAKKLI